MNDQGECRKKCKKRILTPTSLLHIISLDSNISFTAGVARIYAFFFKFCSLRYDTATSEGMITSSCNKLMSGINTGKATRTNNWSQMKILERWIMQHVLGVTTSTSRDLRFSERYCWGFMSSGMTGCVSRWFRAFDRPGPTFLTQCYSQEDSNPPNFTSSL
jgi:hypothetical protein